MRRQTSTRRRLLSLRRLAGWQQEGDRRVTKTGRQGAGGSHLPGHLPGLAAPDLFCSRTTDEVDVVKGLFGYQSK